MVVIIIDQQGQALFFPSTMSSMSSSSRSSSFWGEIVTAEQPVTLHLNDDTVTLRLSQAALGPNPQSSSSVMSALLCQIGDDEPIIICTLRLQLQETCNLNLKYGAPCDIVFSVQGPGPIHISGYFYRDPPSSTYTIIHPNYGGTLSIVREIEAAVEPPNAQVARGWWYKLLGTFSVISECISRHGGLLGGPSRDTNLDGVDVPAITLESPKEIEEHEDKVCDEAKEKVDNGDLQTDGTAVDSVACNDNEVSGSDACREEPEVCKEEPDWQAKKSSLSHVLELPNNLSVKNSSQRGDSAKVDSAVRRKLEYDLFNEQNKSAKEMESRADHLQDNNHALILCSEVEKLGEPLNVNTDAISNSNQGTDSIKGGNQVHCLMSEEIFLEGENGEPSQNTHSEGVNVSLLSVGEPNSVEKNALDCDMEHLENHSEEKKGQRRTENIAINGEIQHSNLAVEKNRSHGHPEKIATDGDQHPNILDEGNRNSSSKEIDHSDKDKSKKRKTSVTDDVNARNPDVCIKEIDSQRDGLLEPKNIQTNVESESVYKQELEPKKRKRSKKSTSVDHRNTIDKTLLDRCDADEVSGHGTENKPRQSGLNSSKEKSHPAKCKSSKRKLEVYSTDEVTSQSKDADSSGAEEEELKPKQKKKVVLSTKGSHGDSVTIAGNTNHDDGMDDPCQVVDPDNDMKRSSGPSDLSEFGEIKKKKMKTKKVEGSGVELKDTTVRSTGPSDLHVCERIKKKIKKEKMEGSGVEAEKTVRSISSSDLHVSGQIKKKKKKEKMKGSGVEAGEKTVRSIDPSDQHESGQKKKKKIKKEKVQESARK